MDVTDSESQDWMARGREQANSDDEDGDNEDSTAESDK